MEEFFIGPSSSILCSTSCIAHFIASFSWQQKQHGQTKIYGCEEQVSLPFNYNYHRMDLLLFKYQLKEGMHSVKIKLLNEMAGRKIFATDGFVYASKPVFFK